MGPFPAQILVTRSTVLGFSSAQTTRAIARVDKPMD